MPQSAPTEKPSPLFFNSARGSRQSPFGRPGSIRQGSPAAARPSTPTSSPLKPKETPGPASPVLLRPNSAAPQSAPSWLKTGGEPLSPGPQLLSPARDRPEYARNTSSASAPRPLSTASLAAMFDGGRERSSTPPLAARASTPPFTARASTPPLFLRDSTPPVASPLASPAVSPVISRAVSPLIRQSTNDALSKLPPPLLHSMRESFSVMDRDDDGHVTPPDVADMLSQLGLSATPSTLSAYFNGAPSLNLATYLNTLADLLSHLSRPAELSAAFAAFDDGDDGQIDLAELKDALLHTPPEEGGGRLTEREIEGVVEGFSGRRAFGKAGKGLGRGEVFRYQEFMASLVGGPGEAETQD
ncbi:hypothetical protein C7974DRAFT_458886, partial [Boeremia exigua]|uniref:uncharacterized protein n=1 Tax=Boeremia exigua TaxID=749465 RepID=UPI001E8E5B2E